MRAEVMEFYRPDALAARRRLLRDGASPPALQDIKQAVYDGDLVALCGVVGAGKTVTLRRLQEMLARRTASSSRSRSPSRRAGSTLGTLITALFCDSPRKRNRRSPSRSELRERELLQLGAETQESRSC